MVDEPINPEGMDNLSASTENASNNARNLNDILSSVNLNLSKIGSDGSGNVDRIADAVATKLSKSLKAGQDEVSKLRDLTDGIVFDPDLSKMKTSFSNIASDGAKLVGGLVDEFDRYAKEANKSTSGLADVAASTGAAAITGVMAKMAEAADKVTYGMEGRINEVHKIALQSGIAFEGAFNKGAASTGTLNDAITGVIQNLVGSRKEALEVANVLSKGMGTKGAITGVTELADAQGRFVQSLSTTEAALAVATATGVGHSDIANNMVLAYQELGETIEGSAKMFGTIQGAAKQSGIGFEKTMGAIIGGAKALKMWGGTVESVTPMFNAFSKSLQDSGIGRQGLTPELFQSFVGGLNKMNFETRALMGIQAGMGGGPGGALGAGLEMEAALEEGPEGMQKILGGLTDTLKNLGGGGILTRDEALENPELTRQFIQQRQLLTQMLGVDEASANKMLDMISATEKTGLQMGDSMSKEFNNLVKQGKETGEQTTSTAEKARALNDAALQKMSDAVVGELKNNLKGTAMQRMMGALRSDLNKTIRTGRPTVGATKQVFDRMRGQRRGGQRRARAGRPNPGNVPMPRAMKRAGITRAATRTPGVNQFKPSAIHSPIVKKLNQSINVQKGIKDALTNPKAPGESVAAGPMKVSGAIDDKMLSKITDKAKPEITPVVPQPTTEAKPEMTIAEKLEARIAGARASLDKTKAMREAKIRKDADPETLAKMGPEATETPAVKAIDKAAETTKTVEAQAGKDIDQAANKAKQEQTTGSPEEATGGAEGRGARSAGAGGGGESAPIEHTIKISAVLENDTIKLDASMLKDFITLGNA